MRRSFVTLDVFTDRRFAGNPLAVVLDAEGLDTAAMQAIAREFSHPETVFVFRRPIPRTARGFASSRRRGNCRSPAIRPSGRRCCSACATAARAGSDCRARGADRPGALHARDRAAPDTAAPASRSRNCRPRPGRRRTTRPSPPRWPRARRDRLWRASARRAGRPATPSPSCRSPGLPRSRAAGPIRPGSTTPFRRRRRPTCSAARPSRRATISMPACSRPAIGVAEDPATGSAAAAFAGLSPRRGELRRRRPRDRHRAGL